MIKKLQYNYGEKLMNFFSFYFQNWRCFLFIVICSREQRIVEKILWTIMRVARNYFPVPLVPVLLSIKIIYIFTRNSSAVRSQDFAVPIVLIALNTFRMFELTFEENILTRKSTPSIFLSKPNNLFLRVTLVILNLLPPVYLGKKNKNYCQKKLSEKNR